MVGYGRVEKQGRFTAFHLMPQWKRSRRSEALAADWHGLRMIRSCSSAIHGTALCGWGEAGRGPCSPVLWEGVRSSVRISEFSIVAGITTSRIRAIGKNKAAAF